MFLHDTNFVDRGAESNFTTNSVKKCRLTFFVLFVVKDWVKNFVKVLVHFPQQIIMQRTENDNYSYGGDWVRHTEQKTLPLCDSINGKDCSCVSPSRCDHNYSYGRNWTATPQKMYIDMTFQQYILTPNHYRILKFSSQRFRNSLHVTQPLPDQQRFCRDLHNIILNVEYIFSLKAL